MYLKLEHGLSFSTSKGREKGSVNSPTKSGRIALYLPNLDGGGAERMMVNLASGFVKRGLATDLVLAEARGPYLEQVAPEVNVVDLKSSGVAASLPRLVRYLRQHQPEALLATLNHANVAAILGCRLAHIRVIVRTSNMLFPHKTSSLRQHSLKESARLLYPLADAHIAVSKGVADDLQKFVRLDPKKVHAIYNPVVTSSLLERARLVPEHPWLADESESAVRPPVLLGVGRLTGQKDFPTLIRAFAAVRRMQAARLIILGEGAQRANLEALAAELGVAEDVSLPGFAENPFAFMARADLFVLSSRFEGLPGALIQAMACGCKVVSTDCPSGPAEILKGGQLAPLVPVGDVEALTQAILATLNEPTPRPELRNRAFDFSEENTIPQYLKVLLPGRQDDDA